MINYRVKPNGDILGEGELDPSDVVDLVINYTQYYKSDAITTITVTGTNITIDSSSETDNVVTIFVSSALVDTIAEVKIKAESATRTLERTLFIRVEQK